MQTKPELVFFNGAELLEGPCWDKKNRKLYFVSIKGNTVFSLETDTGRITSFETDGPVGCAVLRDGMLLTAEKSGIYERNLETGAKKFIAHVYNDNVYRYNDGKLDPKGRFFVGTIGDTCRMNGKCALYRIDGENEFKLMVSGTTVSNGLGWTEDGKTMFFIDTPTKEVWKYDYDLKTGEMSNKSVAAVIDDGSPDGMCVDIDDTLWIAHRGGGKVSHWDMKRKERIGEILLPVTNVSSCCIGGEKTDTLFITTAKSADEHEPLAGGLFKVKIR